jgi:hypothetical protein
MPHLSLRQRSTRDLAALLILMVVASCIGGCASRNLFAERDPTVGRLRYFDSESAAATREERKQVSEMGVGLPSGPSAQ